MQKRLLEANYRFRPPRPSRVWQWLLTPVRRYLVRRMYSVRDIDIRGAQHVRATLDAGHAVMFAINHPAHGDPFVTFEVMHRLRVRCCYLAAWQVFRGLFGLRGFAFQRLGAFSVDREGTDLRSFRTAVDILAAGRYSLVIYPEGEVYHLNDQITPLREGAATIAITADRRRRKANASPVRIVPCAVKYFYIQDPTPILESVMTRIEQHLYWRPRPQTPLHERVYRVAEGLLALKELQYMPELGCGSLSERLSALTEHILSGMEQRRLGTSGRGTVAERVKTLRQDVLKALPETTPAADDHTDLDALHLVTQLSSYPGDYLAKQPSIERVAETIDKLEEDALGAVDAGARMPRRAVVSFGEPLDLAEAAEGLSGRSAAAPITTRIEQSLQQQLDSISSAP
ncbi:MAG: lysophospholipid acyltransferase family protein [Phycisphaerales bacterium]